jgi:hypothetical protein
MLLIPRVDVPKSKEVLVLTGILAAMLPPIVMSSPVALPRVTFPLRVAAPAHVIALMEKSLVPSVIPLIKSVKFVETWVPSAVVAFVKV